MKTPPKVKETLSRIKKNKETLFAVLLGGTRWYTGGLALPLGFVVCRLLLERLKDRSVHKELGSLGEENERLKNVLDEMNVRVIERQSASGPEEDMSKKIVELQNERDDLKAQLKTERQGKTSLESGQREALAIRDAEARQNKIFKKEVERLQSETQKMKDLQAENKDKANIIATNEQKIADLEQESAESQSQIEELKQERQKLMSTIDSEKDSKCALNESLENERKMVQSLGAELKKSQQEAGEKRQLYEISMKTLASEKEQSDSLRANVLELTANLEAEQKTAQELEETLTMKDGIIMSLKEYEYKALKLSEELRSKEREILGLKKNEESNKALIASTKKMLSEVGQEKKQTDELKQQLATFTLSLKDREAQVVTIMEKYDATKLELEDLKKEHSALKSDCGSLFDVEKLLEAEKATNARLQNEVDTLEESLQAANENNTHLQHSLDQKTTIVEAKETMLTESTSRADVLREQVDKMEEKMAQLTLTAKNANTNEKRAAEAEEALLCEQAKTTELETAVQEMTAALKEETRKASDFESELDKKQRFIDVCETKIGYLEGYKQKAEEETKRAVEIDNEVSRLNNYLGSMKLNMDALEETLEEKERQIAELNATNAALVSGKDHLNAQNTASKTEERRLQEHVENMEKKMEVETEKLTALKKENEQLKEADLQAKQVVESLKSSLETKELAIQRKDSEIYRLRKVDEEKEQLKEKETELYKKLENFSTSSNDVIKNLESNLEKTQASLKDEQWKVQSLRDMLSNEDKVKYDRDEGMTRDMKAIQSKYEAEKTKVISLEATRSTSQKMIRDLESILDKKETILAKKQDEIAALKQTLAGVTESQHISETQKQEISMKINQADVSQKIKLSDMLIVSSTFHTPATATNGTRKKSPKGKPTPESMNPWGKRYTEAIEH